MLHFFHLNSVWHSFHYNVFTLFPCFILIYMSIYNSNCSHPKYTIFCFCFTFIFAFPFTQNTLFSVSVLLSYLRFLSWLMYSFRFLDFFFFWFCLLSLFVLWDIIFLFCDYLLAYNLPWVWVNILQEIGLTTTKYIN
jgi:hypothetical protein